MLKTLSQAVEMIKSGKLLHIAGDRLLLEQLPKGNWIGGTTDYFLAESGGLTTGGLLDVLEFEFDTYKVTEYTESSVTEISNDAYPNGFSVAIMPYESRVLRTYANYGASGHLDYLTPIVGWVAGTSLSPDIKPQTSAVVNGITGEIHEDKAVVLHVSLPEDKTVIVNIINVFTPDENSPVIRFEEDGFVVRDCYVDGERMSFAEFLTNRSFNTSLPLVGDYSGENINVTVRSIREDSVKLFAPVFKGVDYRIAGEVEDYADRFRERISRIDSQSVVFSCSCYLSFIYGELEGKGLGPLYGPVTFGEFAYLLVNQTMVYLQVV